MTRFFVLLACAGTVLLGACSDGSALPTATGKAGILAINAIEASPEINFLIEVRAIGTIPYKAMSILQEYDDLDYTFNFDVFFSGGTTTTRIASQHIDFVADQTYTLLIGGTLANPIVTMWEAVAPSFDANATVLQVTFAHTSSVLGMVDYYFAAPGVAPVLGEEVATLSIGENTQPAMFEAGDYVMTITASGDPGNVLYTSVTVSFVAQTVLTILPFDGDFDDTAPVVVRALGAGGAAVTMADNSFPSTVEFVHASIDLGLSDIYDDDVLTSLIVSDHAFQEKSADIPVVTGDNTFRYTPAGSTAMVTLEGTLNALIGRRYRLITWGPSGSFQFGTYEPDRRPLDSTVKVLMFQASSNFGSIDIYIVDADTTIDGAFPFRLGITTASLLAPGNLVPGSYDIYVTAFGETAILAGPVRIDVAFGDVVDMLITDTVDPALLDIVLLP